MITGKILVSKHNPGRRGAAEGLAPNAGGGEPPSDPRPGNDTAVGCVRLLVLLAVLAFYVAGLLVAATILGWAILTFASLFGWVEAWSWAQQLATGALAVFVIGSLRGMRK